MTPLAALLRSARPADPAADADLLGRYRSGDAEAFAELVRRHGRLVWAACRHQTRSAADADDCFQAVWLALARRPAAVRDPAKLSAFLHAVAVRVCRKLRAADDRRTARETKVAVPDGATAVPDTAWDRALAAVHEEVASLPEPLRVAFVRCGLEGQGVTEAAADLGWKLGTLSGRLTRAKDLLTKRLDARGLTAGAVAATVCGGAVPTAVAAAAVHNATAATVPASILSLSHGVIVMNRVKLLAAGLLVAGGLGAGVGGGWLATAGAQDTPVTQPKLTPVVGKPAAEMPPTKWEYFYHPLDKSDTVGRDEFENLIAKHETDGWQYSGTMPAPIYSGRRTQMVFRRQVVQPPSPTAAVVVGAGTLTINGHGEAIFGRIISPPAGPAADYQQRIAALETELAVLKMTAAKAAESRQLVKHHQADLPLGVGELGDILIRLGRKRFGGDRLTVAVSHANGGSLTLTGDQDAQDWAKGVITALGGKPN